METFAERRREYLDQIKHIVGRDGFAVQGVFPAEEDASAAEFWSYTVGLNPELAIVGMPPEQGAPLLNAIVEWFSERATIPTPGEYIGPLGDEYGILLRAVRVDDGRYPFTIASEYRYPGETFDALQVVWPDDEYRYPEHADYDHARFPQPMIEAAL
jgi:hypothetical protein